MVEIMAVLRSRSVILFVVLSTILYQVFLKRGPKEPVEALDTFTAKCHKVSEPGLEGCGDMWLHVKTGMLYMACGDSKRRAKWFPSNGNFKANNGGLPDRMAVLDTRAKGPISQRLKWIKPREFHSNSPLSLQGFDIIKDPEQEDVLHIALVNHRPSMNPSSGELVNNEKMGANSTLEYFTTKVGSGSMIHKQTFFDPSITTPNRVSWLDVSTIAFTNDHSSKVGAMRKLIGGGSVGICRRGSGTCTTALTSLSNPSGILRGHQALIYVPSSTKRSINVYIRPDKSKDALRKVDTIKVPYPITNLRLNKVGDVIATTIPPHGGSTIFRVSQVGELNPAVDYGGWGWYVVNVLEDPEGELIDKATVAVYDVDEGVMWMGGYMSESITYCDRMNEEPADGW